MRTGLSCPAGAPKDGEGPKLSPLLLILAHAGLGLLVTFTLAVVFGGVVMLAWNQIFPAVFNLPALDYGQGVALLVFARLLTGRLTHGYRHAESGRRLAPFKRTAPAPETRLPVPAEDAWGAWWRAEGEGAYHAYLARTDDAERG
ncbi:hypothetical protein F11_09310 [Rhodospirillum rubrum F11]|uniref:Uncharacterized protein n=3 Tax=Rhodospirillum rubrum TaxID=1085 RepID=Q2RTD5_RHORT|nr:hypothetical protein [Rhodospirillum rubrum]ABC22610.1 hypothetical protein Rru_A1810 [Rhodospirillum rubrum ATCC 11170]AEO48328.1 hypothetical protein F11_09310 [Rhodospirillum rubrum F11]MBK5954198.1 hypothetical protein [Rhodospirillum rubrum]QXG82234.1 hypothetical protein KUL73_09375 [Rhodospirillum rubrum]